MPYFAGPTEPRPMMKAQADRPSSPASFTSSNPFGATQSPGYKGKKLGHAKGKRRRKQGRGG